MVNCELNWYQRISIWLRIGSVQAPNMRSASTLYRVIEKIRPTELERGSANLTIQGNNYAWMLPEPAYGTKTVDLDPEEAEQTAWAIENSDLAVQVNDMEWLGPLLERLKAKEESLTAA